MKYWVIDNGEAKGPFDPDELKKLPGFGPSSMIAPDGADTADDWKPATYYLLKPPNPRSEPAERARPAAVAAPVVEPEPTPAPKAERVAVRRSPLLPLALGLSALAAVGAGAYYARQKKLKTQPPADLASTVIPAMPAPAPAAVAAGGGPIGSQPPALPPSGETSPSGVEEAVKTDALALVQKFVVVASPGKYPEGPFDVLTPKKWRAPKTLGELYENRPLEALALEALQESQRRGETFTQAAQEIRKDPEAWKAFSQKFLRNAGKVTWDVEPLKGESVGVVAKLRSPRTGAPERRAFEADLKHRTLKPLDFDSWCDLDAKACAKWARKNLKLGQIADEAAVGRAAPTYAWSRAKPIKPRKQAPGTRPKALEDAGDDGGPDESIADKPLVQESPKPPPPADGDEFDPLAGAQPAAPEHSTPEPQAVASKPVPPPTREKPESPAPSKKNPDEVWDEPKPAPRQPAPETVPPLQEPAARPQAAAPPGGNPPPPAAPSGERGSSLQASPGAKKSVTDMSVDELEKYLNRK